MFSDLEQSYMTRALALASERRIYARPNPSVGCVLVRDNEVVGEGASLPAGQAHAEVVALRQAGERARGASAFVTLEPCCHHGRTPPCTEALIDAGVREVVFAADDPNPRVSGGGAERLRAAGIEVRSGLLRDAAAAVNAGFETRMRRGRPRITLKVAASIDGATAMASGESQWITGTAARADVQALRAACGAVLTGSGTVLADDPRLNVRDRRFADLPSQPLRAVVDSRLRCPPGAKMFAADAASVIFSLDDTRSSEYPASTTVVRCGTDSTGAVDLHEVVAAMADLEINDLLVEAGPRLSSALVGAGLVDEYRVYLAPRILGSATRRMFDLPGIERLADARELTITDVTLIGDDVRLTALPRD